MLDLLLVMALGFLGSFGHCVGMCGPLTAAFALSQKSLTQPTWQQQLYFHSLLNLGRLVSYTLVGASIGALGSVLVGGGQLAGIGSALRQSITIFTGVLLVWLGITQIQPKLLPKLPLLHPLTQNYWHDRLSTAMLNLARSPQGWTPALLGMVWGLIPCGFLYIAQVKAAETSNLWLGAATMLAFGVGTVPAMIGVGLSTALVSADKRSQLFRLGGWVTLAIGILTLLRTGAMVDYTGYASLVCLMLALIARPLGQLLPFLLPYRRALGVGAYILALAHMAHMLDHSFSWKLAAIPFMLPLQQVGIWAGFIALGLMTPAALTSFDGMVRKLGKHWRWIHLLTVPALILVVSHTILVGSTYLGALEWTTSHKVLSVLLGGVTIAILLVRSRWVWLMLSLEKFYSKPPRIS